jgi:hypothetical protein
MCLSRAVSAQSIGVRGGYAADPDMPFFGVHLETPGLTSMGHVTFRPNVEIGSKNEETIVAGNLEVVYWAQLPAPAWSMYFGGGPAVVFHKDPFNKRADGAYHGLVGFQNKAGLFVEMKVGGGNTNGLKATVGYVVKK